MTGNTSTRTEIVTTTPDLNELAALISRDPVVHCFPASRLVQKPAVPVWGHRVDGTLNSALLAGLNMVPIETTDTARADLAEYAATSPRRPSSIAGRQSEVLDLWSKLQSTWPPAREVRESQPFLIATRPASRPPDPLVRLVRQSESEELLDACVAMFTEEMGVSPLAGNGEALYRRRVVDLIRQRRVFAHFEGSTLVFKAELGAVSTEACQVQGVWVHPDFRGRGFGIAGMAAVVQRARQQVRHVSLYVNEYNRIALHVYEQAGFTRHDTFATVLF